MPKPDDTTLPDTPSTERALPRRTGAATVPARPARPTPGRPAGNGRASSPAEVRREIDQTRARMSSTLDAIEARLVEEREALERKKDELVDRATLKPVREKLKREPWRSMAIAFVAGYVVAAIRD